MSSCPDPSEYHSTSTINVHPHYMVPSLPRCLSITIRILSTSGDHHYVGLTGLELVAAGGSVVPLTAADIEATPAK